MQIMYVAISSGSVPVYEQLLLHRLGPQPATAAAAPPPAACQHDSGVPCAVSRRPAVEVNAECTCPLCTSVERVAGGLVTTYHSCTCAGSMGMHFHQRLAEREAKCELGGQHAVRIIPRESGLHHASMPTASSTLAKADLPHDVTASSFLAASASRHMIWRCSSALYSCLHVPSICY
jgi:hypothetical protein